MNAISSPNEMTGQTVQMFRDATASAKGQTGDPLWFKRGVTQATGFVWYDLAAPAKNMFPVITPLRNKVPRVKGAGDVATRWKVVTAINALGLRAGVPEGKRNGQVSNTLVNKLASYKTIGLENSITFEAVNAAVNFEDIRSTEAQRLLWATMIEEEKVILGGNSDQGVALGTTPTPTVANAGTGGAIAAGTYNVICVALTHAGWLASSVATGLPDVQTVTMPDSSTFTYNAGTAAKSAAASTTTTGSTSTISASVALVNNAVGYAWYVGAAGSEKLQAITTINSVLLTSLSTTTQACASLFTADRSQNQYEFDGFLTQGLASGSGATVLNLATGTPGTGTKLSCSSKDGAVDQIEQALKAMWDTKRLSPNVIYLNAQEVASISSLVIGNGGAPIVRLNGDFSGGADAITAGSLVGSYLNRYGMSGGQLVKLQLHPYMPPGTMLMHTDTLPYPISNVPNVAEMHMRQDYYQLDWPITKRQYEFGVYSDGTLAHYFPGAMAIVNNIAP